MATLFYGREGRSRSRSSRGQDIDIELVREYFSHADKHFFPTPPIINADGTPSEFSAYTLVVVEILDGETDQDFPGVGYYWLVQLSPQQCTEITGIDITE